MTILRDTDVLVTTVIGFPHGSNLTSVKVFEAEKAIAQGCKELDMVLNIGRLLGGDYEYVEQDIKAVCDTGHASNIIVKVILENAYLTPELIAVACKISEKAGADFVKTSTGYAPSGATISDLKIMRASTSPKVRIKAAGGVRSLNAALAVRAVGGSRFGCTRTAEIIEDAKKREVEGTLVLPEDPQSF
jgi:deoxyribose-phosphate aldolase